MALDLNVRSTGAAGAPVVILHGLLGAARNWERIAKALAASRRVFALDLRNHGGSPWAETMSYAEMAADVAGFVEARLDRAPALVGHSMGGKAAMWLALERPDLVASLVVVDIAPRAYGDDFSAYIEALRALDPASLGRRAEADARLAERVADPAVRAFLLQNLERTDRGFRWQPNLAALAAAMPDISGFPEPGGRRYDGPALFLSGACSGYVGEADAPAIRRLFPRAAFEAVPGAGHWPHAEAPEAFTAKLAGFLG